ncbi:MAG: histidine phosphatase family protein [Saprospiraceae bacterium]|nr:histidine phosphatase family protein [Saprospiraceae bacterium]
MKRIYIVRHAKSSWSNMSLADIDRPLNKRGKRDAPVMGQKCKELNYVPDQIISSNANRAFSTAQVFRDALGLTNDQVRIEESLYHAPEDTYLEVCFALEETCKSVMLFGHNPGITYLANSVSREYIDNVPTCGVLVIDSSAKSWTDVDFSNSKLIHFIYPKMYG